MSNLGKYQTIVEEAYKEGGVDIWLGKIKVAAYEQGSSDAKNKLLLPISILCLLIGATGQYAYHRIAPKIKASIAYKKQLQNEANNAETLLKQELEFQITEPVIESSNEQ